MNRIGLIKNHNIHSILWKAMTVVWAALIFELSTSTYGPSFSSGLMRVILDFLHVTLSQSSFETIHQEIGNRVH